MSDTTRYISDWWKAATIPAVAPPLARIADDPQPGYYKIRMSRSGPWVALAIWAERLSEGDPWKLYATAGGFHDWPAVKHVIPEEVWPFAQPVTVSAFTALAERNAPGGDLSGWSVPVELERLEVRP